MWYKYNKVSNSGIKRVFYYKEKFQDRVLTITFENSPRYKLIAFRPSSYVDTISKPISNDDIQSHGNPYHMCLKCVFETSGIIGSENIL